MKYRFTLNRGNYIRNDGTQRLYLYTNFGRVKFYPLDIFLKYSQFKRGLVVGHEDEDDLNSYLSGIETDIRKKDLDRKREGKQLTGADIKKILDGEKPAGTINEFYKSQLYDPSFALSSQRDQKQTLDVLNEFNDSIDFADLNFELVQKFNKFLVNKYSEWTTYKHHKNLKKFINIAIKMELIDKNPYLLFKVKRPRSDKIKFLTWDELAKVEAADVSNIQQFQVIKDMFLFSCYTALRFSDVQGLTPGDITENKLSLERMYKVDRRVFLRLDELFKGKAMEVVGRHYGPSNRLLFKRYSNGTVNDVLKDIARVAEVKPLTFHMGRHTFGTLMASKGESIYKIMQWMGISKFETTQVYINLSEELI